MKSSPSASAFATRGLEERQRGLRIAARPQDAASLEVDADAGARARGRERFGFADELLGFVEVVAQTFDPSELRQQLRAHALVLLGSETFPEAVCAHLEVAEVPERSQVVAHRFPRGTNA